MKQQLSEALRKAATYEGMTLDEERSVFAAARLVEGLLPTVTVHSHGADCWCDLGESGEIRVWDEGIVEAVAKALYLYNPQGGLDEDNTEALLSWYGDEARAVLSAIAQLVEKGVKSE